MRSVLLFFSALLLCAPPCAEAARSRRPAPRFRGRLQILSGASMALPEDPAGARRFAAYVPLDIEVGVRLSGPFSVTLGGVGYAAPFQVPACEAGPGTDGGRRPNGLASFVGLRLDLNNSRDGSWLSPWMELRGGVAGQDGVPTYLPLSDRCGERFVLAPWFGPRVGLDLWMGRAAATFALGYDVLPRASGVTVQAGLTLRLF